MQLRDRLIIRLYVFIGAVVALAFGTGCRPSCDAECAEDGLCSVRNYHAGDARYRCYAASDAECAGSRVCRDEGRCFATEQGTCVLEDEVAANACSASAFCSRSGLCGHRDGICWAESDADCEASFECRTIGRCGARGGVCVPRSDTDCERSLGCEVEGLCRRTSYLGLTYECRVPLDNAAACEASWVCEHYGRCAPALTADCEGCRYGFCAEPGRPAVLACSSAAAHVAACSADGRCAPDANYECAHAPIGGPTSVAQGSPTDDKPVRAQGAPAPAPPVDDGTGSISPTAPPAPVGGNPPAPDVAPAPAPVGPGSIEYALAIDDRSYNGVLTYATLLTGAAGFQRDPVDFLVFRATDEDGCNPRSRDAFLPLGAIWLMGALPPGEGTFAFDGGPMPGQMSAKTWLWTGDQNSGSRNLGMHGTIVVTSRTATELRGTVEFRVTEYFDENTIGTVRGGFVTEVVDCSNHTGGWPM